MVQHIVHDSIVHIPVNTCTALFIAH